MNVTFRRPVTSKQVLEEWERFNEDERKSLTWSPFELVDDDGTSRWVGRGQTILGRPVIGGNDVSLVVNGAEVALKVRGRWAEWAENYMDVYGGRGMSFGEVLDLLIEEAALEGGVDYILPWPKTRRRFSWWWHR